MIGFITKDGYAAVPYGKQLMIIFNNEQLEVVKTIKQAELFINNHKAGPQTATPKLRTPKKSAMVDATDIKTQNGKEKSSKIKTSKSNSRRSKKLV
jgi:hypothetical protein